VPIFRAAAECSERHACGQMEIVRAMVRYRPRATRFAEANQLCLAKILSGRKMDVILEFSGLPERFCIWNGAFSEVVSRVFRTFDLSHDF